MKKTHAPRSPMGFAELRDFYHTELAESIIPLWRNSIDHEHGGFMTFLDRHGRVYDHDKLCTWNQGRMGWVFAMLHNSFSPEAEYRSAAARGIEFIKQHGFAPDGSMYYSLDREGRPLAPSQDIFPELFTVLGFAEFAALDDDATLWNESKELLLRTWRKIVDPATTPSPFLRETRPVILHGPFLIALNNNLHDSFIFSSSMSLRRGL